MLRVPPHAAGQRAAAVDGDVERDFAVFLRHHLREARHLPQGQDAVIRPMLAELRREAEERQPGFRFRATALCSGMLVQVVRQLSDRARPAEATESRGRAFLVLRAREYLLKNLNAELHLDQIAGHLHVSSEHLARTFKQETGQTVFTHLQHLRLEKAKTFLLGSDKSITDIAALTGFSSVALFSRTFRRRIGTSPLAYRQERWSRAVENRAKRR
jgi:transcriptional regulator GlxA family with amidase domain